MVSTTRSNTSDTRGSMDRSTTGPRRPGVVSLLVRVPEKRISADSGESTPYWVESCASAYGQGVPSGAPRAIIGGDWVHPRGPRAGLTKHGGQVVMLWNAAFVGVGYGQSVEQRVQVGVHPTRTASPKFAPPRGFRSSRRTGAKSPSHRGTKSTPSRNRPDPAIQKTR